MHIGVRSHTVLVNREDWALSDLKPGSLRAANTSVDVPDTRATLAVQVVLNDDSTWCGALSLDEHVGPLDAPRFSGLADLNDRMRDILVAPMTTRGHEYREGLSDHPGAGWNIDCVGQFVDA